MSLHVYSERHTHTHTHADTEESQPLIPCMHMRVQYTIQYIYISRERVQIHIIYKKYEKGKASSRLPP